MSLPFNNTTVMDTYLIVGVYSLAPTIKTKLKTSENFRLRRLLIEDLRSFVR